MRLQSAVVAIDSDHKVTSDVAARVRGDFFDTAPDTAQPKAERRKPTSALLNFWLDLALALSLIVVVWISVLLQVVFPAPTSATGWSVWGLTYDQWRDIQFFSLCTAAILAVEHVVLHWNWVCGVIVNKVLRVKNRPDEANQSMYGIATFFLIVRKSEHVAASAHHFVTQDYVAGRHRRGSRVAWR